MYKIFISFFLLLFCQIISCPVSVPTAPRLIEEGFFTSPASSASFRLGYEGNFVWDAKLEETPETRDRIDSFQMDAHMGVGTINIINRFDMYGACGESRIQGNWRIEEIEGIQSRLETETKYRLCWAAGAKALLFEWGKTALALGGKYFFTQPKMLWLIKDGSPIATDDTKIQWKEWQVDLALSHKVDLFTPYIGMKFDKKKVEMDGITQDSISSDGSGILHMKERNCMGMALGCALSQGKQFMLVVEVRFFDEEGATIIGDLKF